MDTARDNADAPTSRGPAVSRTGKNRTHGGHTSRQLILDFAALLFSTRGFTATTMREIATGVGIKSGSIYYHFESKEQILSEVLTTAVNTTRVAVGQAIDSLSPDATPQERIIAGIRSHISTLYANIAYTSANVRYHGQIPESVNNAVRPAREEYNQYWSRLLEDAAVANYLKPDLNISLTKSMILSSMNNTIGWYDASRGDVEQLINTILIGFSGIWASPQASPSEPQDKTKND